MPVSLLRSATLCCASYRDKYPANMYLLAAWTFVEAYTIGVVCAAYASQGQVCQSTATPCRVRVEALFWYKP